MSKPDQPASGAASSGKCPICGQPRHLDYKPFCSKRCADVDLNRWLGGVYAVPAQPAADEGDDEPHNQGSAGGE